MGILRRLVCALTLVPIVFATATATAACCQAYLVLPGFDELRWMHLFMPLLAVFCSILIWRSVIIWTLGRQALTAALAVVPFLQVVFGRPLWDAGCVTTDLLRIGQGQVGIALWIWLMIWVWWGWERFRRSTGQAGPLFGRLQMNRSVKLVVASIGTLPFGFGMFFIVGIALEDIIAVPSPYLWPLAYLTAATLAILAWLVIWRAKVQWTSTARWRTAASAVLLIGLPAGGTVLIDLVGSPLDAILCVLPVVGWGFWMASTMWLWPLQVSGMPVSVDGPSCLRCGYLLKGLTRTRCPECGTEPTLDELWAATCADSL
jgi:hypothetical protein